jgi:inorganic pyrophosphatase
MDDKIIAVPFSDPTYLGIESIDSLPPHLFDEIVHFFSVYKQLENKQTDVQSLFGPVKAVEIIQDAIDCYHRIFVEKDGTASTDPDA